MDGLETYVRAVFMEKIFEFDKEWFVLEWLILYVFLLGLPHGFAVKLNSFCFVLFVLWRICKVI